MMKKTIILLFTSVFLLQCSHKSADKNELLWSDEFNYTGVPDSAIWGYEEGFVRNRELQKYTSSPSNVRVEDGFCIISCKMESDSSISSASLSTWGKKNVKFNRVEVRAKIPSALGSWPAIWLLGNNKNQVGWPTCGEIDIMENVGFNPLEIHANVHTRKYNHAIGTNKGNSIEVTAPWEDFHIYSMNWYKDRIDFFFDDSLYFTYNNDGEKDLGTWPFAESHFLLLNLAFGGSWGGREGVDLSALPLEFIIDYVRVYKK